MSVHLGQASVGAACAYCSPGTFTSQAGMTFCLQCNQGYTSGTGAVSCTACVAGWYAAWGDTSCTECPSGQ